MPQSKALCGTYLWVCACYADFRQVKVKIEAKNGLENYAYSMRNALNDTKMSDKYADQVASKQKALDALKDLYYQPLVPKVERSKDYIAKVCAAMYAGNSAKDVQV